MTGGGNAGHKFGRCCDEGGGILWMMMTVNSHLDSFEGGVEFGGILHCGYLGTAEY